MVCLHHIIYRGYWDMSNPEHIDIERLTFFNKQKDIGICFDQNEHVW